VRPWEGVKEVMTGTDEAPGSLLLWHPTAPTRHATVTIDQQYRPIISVFLAQRRPLQGGEKPGMC